MDEDSLLSQLIKNDAVYDDEHHRQQQSRQEKYKFDRLDMSAHFEMCERTDGFQRRYHMSRNAFNRLLHILKDGLSVNVAQSMRSTKGNGAITAEMSLAIGLRFMGGESPKSLADIFGVHVKLAERVVNKFLVVIEECKHLDLSIDLLPQSDMEMKKLAHK